MFHHNPEALYQRLAGQVAGELPGGWTDFAVGYLLDTAREATFLVYYSRDGRRTWSDRVAEAFDEEIPAEGLFDAQETCEDLYDLCAASGDRFTVFTMQVDAEGHFRADFEYDSFEEFSKMMLDLWKDRYL